jgi:hypothetical protein
MTMQFGPSGDGGEGVIDKFSTYYVEINLLKIKCIKYFFMVRLCFNTPEGTQKCLPYQAPP